MPMVKVDDVNIYYEITGEGPALVLLHGWTGNHKWWKEQVPFFSKNYKVITLDHRGHGESDKPRSGYSMQVFTEDLYRVLNELRIDRAIIAGHSMGGMIAQLFCLSYPEKVGGLVLVDTSSNGMGVISFEDVLVSIQTQGFESFTEQFFCPALFASGISEEIINWTKSEILKTPQHAVEEAAKAMSKYDVTDQLPKIKVPTLIIHGNQDFAIDLKMAKMLHEKISNSRLKVIDGAGHCTMLEKPDEFNKIVLEFLKKLG